MILQNRWVRRIAWAIAIVAAVFALMFLVLRTPDTDRAAMIAKYAPARSGSRFVTLADGARVHVRDTGGADGRPVIVLIHGSNSSLHTWQPLIRLMRGDYQIITMDMPGHGLTGATPTARYDTAEMVDTVDAVTRRLGLSRFILGGNSMGGGISWRYAVAHADRVQALLLLDAGGMPPRAGDPPQASNIGFQLLRYAPGRLLMRQISPRFLVERSLRQSVSKQAIVTETSVTRYWELLRFPGNRDATVIRFARGWDTSSADLARRITVPTLVLFGAEDRIINPSAAQSFAERISGASVVIMLGVGHLPMEEAPAATANAIRSFLNTVNLNAGNIDVGNPDAANPGRTSVSGALQAAQ